MSSIRVAAVDCGTNSIRLLIADIDPQAGHAVDLDRRLLMVRLGQDVDRTGRLAPEALERTFAACREYAAVIAEYGVAPERTRFVATSATRDAENSAEFAKGVRAILGVDPEVVSGDEEAQLSFAGATKGLAGTAVAAPYLVFDLGGGSTEFVLGGETVRAARSVDIGSVRLTERHFAGSDVPTSVQIAAAEADIAQGLNLAAETVPLTEAATLVGLAGTVTSVAAIALGLPEYQSARIHHSRLSLTRVREVTEQLLGATHAERAAIPSLHPGRVDVIGAGALVLRSIMERTGAAELVVSEHDILDGVAWSLVS
ncbi:MULTISPECIES: Ppx/GppA phosphatase family protein [Kitasatospora]|uniref:Ppx/GppA phosphatase family protein n=1 Tax=Kitasatospora TaxID=2063 RepID=UPI000C6FE505|nr:Ppx/GppA phosphatase family protein [Kitasatospora sp. GP30]MDH6144008.1 exopolyphosphatase/guanosine-5'-triphosphate,3'-diphosphate pyrophosphatase [Kitasatospora sp. GP30]